jgi:hypothetical protein
MKVTVEGKQVSIDKEDLSLFQKYREYWRLRDGYVFAHYGESFVFLHRLVLGLEPTEIRRVGNTYFGTITKGPKRRVSFRNGNRLDCRKANLRIGATPKRIVSRNYRARHPVRAKAHNAINHAISNGTLKKKPCAICEGLEVEAHHIDYSKPFEVIWLCRNHHLKADLLSEENTTVMN